MVNSEGFTVPGYLPRYVLFCLGFTLGCTLSLLSSYFHGEYFGLRYDMPKPILAERGGSNTILYNTSVSWSPGSIAYNRCNHSSEQLQRFRHSAPWVYAITPTFNRPMQKAELVKQINTFKHVMKFHWILVEDSPTRTDFVSELLRTSGLYYTHLYAYSEKKSYLKGRLQRQAGIDWLRQHKNDTEGVVYFADDDNVYSIDIFEEMRFTRKVAVWPVAFAAGLRYEAPVVKNGSVTGWITGMGGRVFPVDMASFAVNLRLMISQPNARFRSDIPSGYMETSFLENLGITTDDLEPKANNCTKVMVWHVKSQTPNLANEKRLATDPRMEV